MAVVWVERGKECGGAKGTWFTKPRGNSLKRVCLTKAVAKASSSICACAALSGSASVRRVWQKLHL